MTPEQQVNIEKWKYWLSGITDKHRRDWRADILRSQGLDAANDFDRKCGYVRRLI